MIGHEDDEGVLTLAIGVQGVQHAADSVVQGDHLGGVLAAGGVRNELDPLKVARMRLENVHRSIVAIVPALAEMRRVVGDKEKKGPRGIALAEVTHGLIRDQIRGIAGLVEQFAIAVPVGRVAVA